MSVHVRLQGGFEDTHAPYVACTACGFPATGAQQPSDYATGPCPNCNAGKFDWRDNRTDLSTCFWNPSVETPEDGTLTVARWNVRIAYYPAGAWISWRAD